MLLKNTFFSASSSLHFEVKLFSDHKIFCTAFNLLVSMAFIRFSLLNKFSDQLSLCSFDVDDNTKLSC
jgi:hypothetical protein